MEHRPAPTGLDWGKMPGPGPQTESSKERGFPTDPEEEKERGQSEALDPDPAGDIADEGPGHRG